MCGIAGFIGTHGSINELDHTLGAMLASIRHRGPDDEGRWLDAAKGCAIGMRRLSIVDLAGGHQPIWNEDQTVGIVFNGEIYNHASLRSELTARGHRFNTRSDTEVLVHLYEETGVEMFARLQGMYAFAIIDRRADTLLLARDPFGQKPLDLFNPRPGALAFASEAKALKHVPGWQGEIDRDAYLDYICWLSLPAPRTHWRGVEKLLPGEWRKLSLTDASEIARGRTPALVFAAQPDLMTAEAASIELERALKDSVRRHLEADVPVGLLLSGGNDSLALGWAVSRAGNQRLHTFTAGFEGEGNEFAPARQTAALVGSEHHEVLLGPDILADRLAAVLHHLDEPIGDPAAVAVLAVCEAAAKHVKVLLGGEGSDELLAGYATRYAGLAAGVARQNRLAAWLGWLPGHPTGYSTNRIIRTLQRARTSGLADLLSARVEGFGPYQPWLRKHASQLLPAMRTRSEMFSRELQFPRSGSALDQVQLLDLRWQLPESLLVKADRMSMAASVELRCPYVDPVVAAVAARLAPAARIDATGGLGKLALRALLKRVLPQNTERPKIGFPLPLGRWLRGPLADDLRSRLTANTSSFVGLVGAKAAATWCNDFALGRQSPHLAYALWLYERWRHHTTQS
jgi:asparagine synthase (glutamine-hydrolysing)